MKSSIRTIVAVLPLLAACGGEPQQSKAPAGDGATQARCHVDGLWQFTTEGVPQQGQGCSSNGAVAQGAIERKVRVSTLADGSLQAQQLLPSTVGSDGVNFIATVSASCELQLDLSFHFDMRKEALTERTRFRYQDRLSLSEQNAGVEGLQVSGTGTVTTETEMFNDAGEQLQVSECSEALRSSGTFIKPVQ